MTARLLIFRRCLMVGAALLVVRLGHLQLLHGAAYRQLAEQNRLRLVPQPAPRGLILDRHGRRLATSRIAFRVAAIPQEVGHNRQEVFARLEPIVHLSVAELDRRFRQQRYLPFLPAALVAHVPKATALRVEEARLTMPGVVVESVVSRHYPFGPVGAHLIGYLSQPSSEAFKTLKEYGVNPKDLVGRAGLEGELDVYLRGQPGGSLIEVDHRARQVGLIGRKDPVPGQPVTLTVDAELESLIAQRFGQQAGAAVVLNPQTGELLAMVSMPSFDPEVFATQDQAAIRALLADPNAPLLNRAAAGTYLPGSIIKPITAMTALRHRVVTPQTPITCGGHLVIGNRRFHCWNRDGHGVVTMREALMWSCNVYFMELGRRLGLDRLRAGFQQAGFGRKTGWHFEEEAGHLPSARNLREGEVAMLAMGQGEILITPLQAAIMVSAIANGGRLVEPWAVRTIGDYTMRAPSSAPLGWPAEHLAAVREGMLAAINDPHGTGIRARSERVPIAGKTGTAQTHVPGKTHGWFIGFCPAHEPTAAMAIVAEYGGSGGELPAMVGRAVCDYLAADRPAADVGSARNL